MVLLENNRSNSVELSHLLVMYNVEYERSNIDLLSLGPLGVTRPVRTAVKITIISYKLKVVFILTLPSCFRTKHYADSISFKIASVLKYIN